MPVPVDDRGVDVAALDTTRAQAVVLTPAHQWPTGVVLAPERRLALLDWAARRNAIIIEDDYDAEFRYDKDPVGVIQGLAPDRVVALGTVSKSLAPVLRLGWIVCPPHLAGPSLAASSSLTAARQDWTSLRWPSSSRLGGMTGTCGGCGPNTRPAAISSSRRSPTMPRQCG